MRQRNLQAVLVVMFAGLIGVAGVREAAAQAFGTVVSVEGEPEIAHAGTWSPAIVGTPVRRGDEIRTTQPGARLSVISIDSSVLNIGEGVDLTIEDFIFEPRQKQIRSLVRLQAGKIRPVVSDSYRQAGGVYEIVTGTALVRVQGTEFVMAYDPVAEVSEVVGVAGKVEVRSPNDRPGRRGVFVTTQQLSTVAKGKSPTAAQSISDRLFRQYIEGLEFIGSGRAQSQVVKHPLLSGQMVPPSDHIDALPSPSEGAPGETGGDSFASGPGPVIIPQPPIRRPPWPLLVIGPGEDFPGTCVTVGCVTDGGPPGASRNTGDIGIHF